MNPPLTHKQQQALENSDGFVQGASYALMSKDKYREMMGVGTDEELAASLEAIRQGLADVDAGRTRPFREVLDELGKDDDTRG